MAVLNRLTDKVVKLSKPKDKPYRLQDGGGLYLEISPAGPQTPTGAKRWYVKYRFANKEKRLSLGVYPATTLKEAREDFANARKLLTDNVDPGQQKQHSKLTCALNAINTFQAVGEEWFGKKVHLWSETHKVRTRQLLEQKLYPWIGSRPIADITPPELLGALRHTEIQGTHETAIRAKQVASQVFRYGVATGRCERDPSQDLRGALTTPKGKHFASITDPKEVGRLLLAIDGYQGTFVVKFALKLSPLLFLRPSELRTMEWSEINWEQSQLEIPANKMKMGQPHIVPLARQSLEILRSIEEVTGHGIYVFPSPRGASRTLSDNGVRTALRTLGYTNEQMTPHGFRAMARTILDEVLHVRIDWIEHQLAHTVKDTNGRAYNRTSHLDSRREMMQKWADYLDQLRVEVPKSTSLSHRANSH